MDIQSGGAKVRLGIVDAYSSGSLLARAANTLGYDCVHIQSTPSIPAFLAWSFAIEVFTVNLVHTGDNFAEIVDRLRSHQVSCVIAGSEMGVLLADRLANELGLKCNPIERSLARRDKRAMHATAREHGKLRVPEQMATRELDHLLGWVDRHGLTSVVLKPALSAGSDGVFKCGSAAEIARAFHQILGKRNKFGMVNDEVLTQEFIDGTEFAVNTVSCDGNHRLVQIWEYKKLAGRRGEFIYDCDKLLSPTDTRFERLNSYVISLLDALAIRYGPSHSEIMVDAKGPVLIETAARLDGAIQPELDGRSVGHGQVELTFDSYLNPDAFFRKTGSKYCPRQTALIVHLISSMQGPVLEIPGLAAIRELPSFFDVNLRLGVGDSLTETVDLSTSPGYIFLSDGDASVVERDYEEIRRMERAGGLFVVGR